MEGHASIVTETLKNGIFISIDISSDYYADSKYIRFIKLSASHKKLRTCKNLSDNLKREETPLKVK